MQRAVSDTAFDCKLDKHKLNGLTGSYVNDNLDVGDAQFGKTAKFTLSELTSKPLTTIFIIFVTLIETLGINLFLLDQKTLR